MISINNRSQITVFILIGMLILFILGFLVYLTNTLVTQKMDPGGTIDDDASSPLDVKNAIQSCYETSLTDGLILLGEQGGFIYGSQGGNLINWNIPGEQIGTYFVSFQVYRPVAGRFKSYPNVLPPPYYPCYDPEKVIDPKSQIYVGDNCYTTYTYKNRPVYTLGLLYEPTKNVKPSLCHSDQSVSSSFVRDIVCTCTDSMSNCIYSIQSQLETYVKNKTFECLMSQDFPDYTITPGNISVSVIFAKKDISSDMTFPVEVAGKGSSSSEIYDFEAEVPIRFYFLYDLIFRKSLLVMDSSNSTFDIVRDGYRTVNEMNKRYGFSNAILTISRVNVTESADLIIINDSSSLIAGKPYIFKFLRENRHPALDHINDISVNAGERIFIKPIAFDPDEDNLTYTYEDWRSEEFESSLEYTSENNPECMNPVTGSLDRYRCASATTDPLNPDDLGDHIVTVKVTDPDGLSDWQNLTVRVTAP